MLSVPWNKRQNCERTKNPLRLWLNNLNTTFPRGVQGTPVTKGGAAPAVKLKMFIQIFIY